MKKLCDIEKEITELKDRIFCQENSNDFYFSSPLYHKQLFELQALESEKMVLTGKMSPFPINFDQETMPKRKILQKLAQEKGIWYAHSHKDLPLEELLKINSEKIKQ